MDLDQLRSRLSQVLEAHPEVDLALLFGSQARGAAGPASDIDIAVLGSSVDALGLAVELTEVLGTPVDVVDLTADPPLALLLELLRDGRKVHEGRRGAYGRFLAHALMVLETDLPAHRAMQRAFVRRVAIHGLTGGS